MRRTVAIMLIAVSLASGAAHADYYSDDDIGYRGWGPRIGLSIDPDQVHFGAHLDFGNFGQHVRFQPNLELGLGEDVTLMTVNAEAAYRFRSRWEAWSPYLGGGVGVNVRRFDRSDRSDTDTNIGVNLMGGIERGLSGGDRFFLEAKFSLNDVPDAKITMGWTFYH